MALIAGTIRYCVLSYNIVRFPYGLDYGEGIVWQQMRFIMTGQGYAPIDRFPAIVFHYPPLYHVTSALTADALRMDQLAAGRLVSAIATLITVTMIAVIVARFAKRPSLSRIQVICGIMAAMMALNSKPFFAWATVMRVDMLCLAWTLCGLYCGMCAIRFPRLVHIAAMCFVAAIFTKQTALAAPFAVFATLLLVRPRTAFAGIATGLVLALATLALLEIHTNGGFLHHIVLYNLNRFRLKSGFMLVTQLGEHVAYISAAIAVAIVHFRSTIKGGSIATIPERLRDDPDNARAVMLGLYLVATTAMLALVFKSGASYNYFLEWICVLAIYAGLILVDLVSWILTPDQTRRPALALVLLPWLICLQAVLLYAMLDPDYDQKSPHSAKLEQIVSLVRDAQHPVISDDMVAILRGGKSVQWEPSIFAELASEGIWPEAPFLSMIQQHHFAFFITEGRHGDGGGYDARYTPTVDNYLNRYYPENCRIAEFYLRFPDYKTEDGAVYKNIAKKICEPSDR